MIASIIRARKYIGNMKELQGGKQIRRGRVRRGQPLERLICLCPTKQNGNLCRGWVNGKGSHGYLAEVRIESKSSGRDKENNGG